LREREGDDRRGPGKKNVTTHRLAMLVSSREGKKERGERKELPTTAVPEEKEGRGKKRGGSA